MLRRLVASIRRLYPLIPIVVIDDSAQPLDPVPKEIARYVHLPFDSAGHGRGRNLGLREVATEYVLVCDDDMVFERKTDLAKMLRALEATRFDLVSCVWIDHDPWTGVPRGVNHFEGTMDVEDGVLVHRYGAIRGTVDGLPVFDVVHQFFMARVDRLGEDPWDEDLRFVEHAELFLSLKERGFLCTRLPDVVVHHRPERPAVYQQFHSDRQRYEEEWRRRRGFQRREFSGRLYSPGDRIRYELPGTVAHLARRAARVGRRLLREGRLRAGVTSLIVLAALAAGPATLAATITIGKGLGPWTLGQKYAKRPGLLRTERRPGNTGPGCVAGPPTASRIEFYRTLRLSWRGTKSARRNMYLIDIATTKAGDRTRDGFVIGRSRLRGVRRAHPNSTLTHPSDRYRLGKSLVSLVHKAGPESWVSMLYWFDRRRVLVALETSASGC